MIAGVVPRRANKRIDNRLALLAIAYRRVQSAPQTLAQGFGYHQTLAFKTLHDPVRQCGDTHSR